MSARDAKRRARVRPEHRPPGLTKWQLSVLRACPRFTGDMYKYMTLVWELSGEKLDGDFMSQAEAARELGLNPDYVGDLRLHLARVGLLIAVQPEGSSLTYHYLTVPRDIEAAPPADARIEQRRAWIAQQVARLIGHVDRQEADPKVRGSSPILRARDRARARGSSPRPRGTSPSEGVDRGETTLPEGGISPHTEHEKARPPGSSVYTQESKDDKSVNTPLVHLSADNGARAPQGVATETAHRGAVPPATPHPPRPPQPGEFLQMVQREIDTAAHGKRVRITPASDSQAPSNAADLASPPRKVE